MPKKLSKQPTLGVSHSAASAIVPPTLLDPTLPLPRLVVFDLDYTLWPFWVDTHVTPPFKASDPPRNSGAVDRYGEDLSFYADVPAILELLPQLPGLVAGGPPDEGRSLRMAVASRTSAPGLARDLLKLLHIYPVDDATALAATTSNSTADSGSNANATSGKPRRAVEVFEGGLEMYPSSKKRHFEAIQKRTGIRYEDMLYFDDEPRNRDTETLGVTMWLVRDGVSWGEIAKGVDEWRRRRGHTRPA
jgi:magnesium-dependent phosphatase 1